MLIWKNQIRLSRCPGDLSLCWAHKPFCNCSSFLSIQLALIAFKVNGYTFRGSKYMTSILAPFSVCVYRSNFFFLWKYDWDWQCSCQNSSLTYYSPAIHRKIKSFKTSVTSVVNLAVFLVFQISQKQHQILALYPIFSFPICRPVIFWNLYTDL